MINIPPPHNWIFAIKFSPTKVLEISRRFILKPGIDNP
uniref:Uncharacterized protein n=1 Tax=Lepeophtheirus salmonis TaxID=72036 RepID=A0A0K2T1H6_LEPSM